MSALLQDVGAGDVHRHEIGRELDATEGQRHRFREPTDEQRFRQSRHAHEQRMSAGEKADGQLFDDVVLADDDLLQLVGEPSINEAQFINRGDIILGKGSGLRGIGHGAG